MPLHRIAHILLLCVLSLPALAGLGERNPSLLAGDTPRFLPVHDAYRATTIREDGRVRVQWQIADGYYLYRHAFKSPLPITTPAGLAFHDEFFGDTEVYYSQVAVLIDTPPDTAIITLSFQGCADAGLCYPPETLHWDAATLLPIEAPAAVATPGIPMEATQSLAWIALAAFIGGLILNLMPCVFPVLSLKIIAITTHAHRGSTLGHALSYSAGVIASFLLVGGALLAIRAGGATVGWGFQLQSPYVIAALAWLFTGISITLWGWFMPGLRWLGVGQSLTEGSGPGASFFTGALAVVVASPCTAPFMATALGYAITQPPAITLTVFACLGAGMAAPFLVLGLMPGLARCLPKPGPWMERFKHWLVLPMAAAVAWLLWVLSHQASSTSLLLVSAGCLALVIGSGLLAHHAQGAKRAIAWSLLVASLLPMLAIQAESKSSTEPGQAWSAERVATLRQQGSPVFLNVTADWCITCLANEKVVLDTDATRDLFARHGVVYLKADWTRPDPSIDALLASFGRSGVPLYVFYPANPGAGPVVLPQILRPDTFKAVIEDKIGTN